MATRNGQHGWLKSSFCADSGCVEVRITPGREVAVRDTKDRTGPVLVFTPAEWTAFLAGAQQGEFDLA